MKKYTEMFDIERLLSDDIEYKKEYFTHRAKVLRALYASYPYVNIPVRPIYQLESEIRIFCKSGLEVNALDKIFRDFTLEIKNLEDDKEQGVVYPRNQIAEEILSNVDAYLEDREDFYFQIFKSKNFLMGRIGDMTHSFILDCALTLADKDKVQNKIDKYYDRFSFESMNGIEDVHFYDRIKKLDRKGADEARFLKDTKFLWNRLKDLTEYLKFDELPKVYYDDILSLCRFEMWLAKDLFENNPELEKEFWDATYSLLSTSSAHKKNDKTRKSYKSARKDILVNNIVDNFQRDCNTYLKKYRKMKAQENDIYSVFIQSVYLEKTLMSKISPENKEAIEGIYQKFKKELTLHLQHKLNILKKIRNGEIVETVSTKESEFGR